MTTACWWGGLTVYAAVVVPVGAAVLGSVEQGFVTQRVTNWLNVLAAVSLLTTARPVLMSGHRRLQASWSIFALTLGALAGLHPVLDSLLNADTCEVLDPERFYTLHQFYLWATTAQWLAGGLMLWSLLSSAERSDTVGHSSQPSTS
ncbi:MAG: hypothetical protein KDA75_11785 [Planctomycetaceae bacterium]|nr:hypothetical protein [Planctomycetaceae bacterium]